MLKTFEPASARQNYWTIFESPFTSLCPLTGETNSATIRIDCLPDKTCLESKSLETYLESFGDVQVGREEVVTRILDDLIKVSNARQMVIRAFFAPQDGMTITIQAEHPSPAPKRGHVRMNSA